MYAIGNELTETNCSRLIDFHRSNCNHSDCTRNGWISVRAAVSCWNSIPFDSRASTERSHSYAGYAFPSLHSITVEIFNLLQPIPWVGMSKTVERHTMPRRMFRVKETEEIDIHLQCNPNIYAFDRTRDHWLAVKLWMVKANLQGVQQIHCFQFSQVDFAKNVVPPKSYLSTYTGGSPPVLISAFNVFLEVEFWYACS